MHPIANYLSQIKKNIAHGDATEHTHRPALKALLEASEVGITATNEPKRKTECGAPDISVTRKQIPLGYVETKDVGTNLLEMQRGKGANGEQFIRYRDGLPNWILTDYVQFQWWVAGEKRLTATVAALDDKGKLQPTVNGEAELARLLDAFLTQSALTISTPQDLATRMAGMARNIHALILRTFAHGDLKEKRWLTDWLEAFKTTLVPDLDEKKFADMFAQTLTYGLFAARMHAPGDRPFVREMAAHTLPKTNPFLRKLFEEFAGVSMPETFSWAVDDLSQLLRHADIGKALKDFASATAKRDPVVHFYETFLAAYDRKLRKARGVYYTPEPVVEYIVHSVDSILREHFGRKDGLGDGKTLILDPAVGTATFPFFIIQEIHRRMNRQRGAWNEYVADQLLNRLFGFELLVAPYAVAHLKLGIELQNTGYEFQSDQRLGVYLTNTLEEAAKRAENLFATWISDEANAAADIKRELPILVVLGNPPYAGHSANRSQIDRDLSPGDAYTVVRRAPKKSQRSIVQRIAKKKMHVREKTFIGQLVDDYYYVDEIRIKERNPKWLQDDYVKFIRFAQWRIERTGHGVLAFITNNGYLDNPTFRGMRHALLQSFGQIHVYNLHGSEKKKERTPEGGKDENVFDIRQGVAIILAVRQQGWKGIGQVRHADLWGTRETKYAALESSDIDSTHWAEIQPRSPNYFFVPVDQTLAAEFEEYPHITEVMPVNVLGFQSHRDHFAISFEEEQIRDRISDLRNQDLTDEFIRETFTIPDNRDWKLNDARAAAREDREWQLPIISCLYRPFDFRYCYFSTVSMDYPRRELLQHVAFQENLCLGLGRQGLAVNDPIWSLICASTHPIDANVFRRGGVNIFPLWLYPRKKSAQGSLLVDAERKMNFAPAFLARLASTLGFEQQPNGLPQGISAEQIIEYIYAVLNCQGYRRRYADFLRSDFPRIPIISDVATFRSLAQKGQQLLQAALMVMPDLDNFITGFPESGDNMVQDVAYNIETMRVWINPRQYFEGITPEIWSYLVGGYQVCDFWLKERRGRKLGWNDIQHYQRMIVAITQTIRIVSEIDALIPAWPLT